MKLNKSQLKNILFLIFIGLLIIPQTRQPIQVLVHSGLAMLSPSIIDKDERVHLLDYNWKLKDIDGNDFNLIAHKNKVIILNFWATWCPPCIAEMPSLQNLYNDYNDEVVFVFVSNEDVSKIKEFLNKHEYNFNVYVPQEAYPEEINIKSIPRTFIVDKGGEIVVDKVGAANWNSRKVRKILDTLLSN